MMRCRPHCSDRAQSSLGQEPERRETEQVQAERCWASCRWKWERLRTSTTIEWKPRENEREKAKLLSIHSFMHPFIRSLIISIRHCMAREYLPVTYFLLSREKMIINWKWRKMRKISMIDHWSLSMQSSLLPLSSASPYVALDHTDQSDEKEQSFHSLPIDHQGNHGEVPSFNKRCSASDVYLKFFSQISKSMKPCQAKDEKRREAKRTLSFKLTNSWWLVCQHSRRTPVSSSASNS